MTRADRVLSTPPTSAPIDTTRRRFLSQAALVAAGGAALGVALPLPVSAEATERVPDPIFAAIEAHRAAVLADKEAVRVEFSYEEEAGCVRDMNDEQRQSYEVLSKATEAAWDNLETAGAVNTIPATIAGIVALSRYLEPLLNDPDNCELPEYIAWDDETKSTPASAFANVIAVAVKAMIEGERLA